MASRHCELYKVCPKTGQIIKSKKHFGWVFKVFFPVVGLFSLIWFLVRVIPKPSRAAYPCQRVAAPLASGFVIWVLGMIGSVAAFRRAKKLLRAKRIVMACLMLTLAVGAIYWPMSIYSRQAEAGVWIPSDPVNTPVGEAKGIFPGRVVWAHDPDATSWNGTTGSWWNSSNTNQTVVSQMLSDVLNDIAGANNSIDAWDRIFKHYNATHDKGLVGYDSSDGGEKIAIKLNMNMTSAHSSGLDSNGNFTAPQVVLALIRQLVNNAGVPEGNIVFYDVSRWIPYCIYNPCNTEFPGVRFVDYSGGDGREVKVTDYSAQIHWSDDLEDPCEIGGGSLAYLPTCVTEADYMINLASLKGHVVAGVTFGAKNHFGSFCTDAPGTDTPKKAGLHPYIAVHNFFGGLEWIFLKRDMGTYTPLVDLMGHKDLGGKTILYLIDGLYSATSQNQAIDNTCKWSSVPFGDGNDVSDWTSSIFASQDPVAIESVALDFIRAEPAIQQTVGVLQMGDSVDNYLHEAAGGDSPPSLTFYDPEADGNSITSLGVHEHWDDPATKQYTRNLGTGNGIELVISPLSRIGPGDVEGDGCVNLVDFCYLADQWLDIPASPSADLWPVPGDAFVDEKDLSVLSDEWMECYGSVGGQ